MSDKLFDHLPGCEWKDIECAPKDGTHILATNENNITVVYWCNLLEQWNLSENGSYAESSDYYPTKWMMLPNLPDGKEVKRIG